MPLYYDSFRFLRCSRLCDRRIRRFCLTKNFRRNLFDHNILRRQSQADLPVHIIKFPRFKQLNCPVLSVKSRLSLYFPAAQPADALRYHCPCRQPDILRRYISQDGKLISQTSEHFLVHPLDSHTGSRFSARRGDYLREGHKTFKHFSIRPEIPFRPISQLFHTVRYAYRQFFPTDRAFSVKLPGLSRTEAKMALAVPVEMIFSFLRKEFNCSLKALARLNRFL